MSKFFPRNPKENPSWLAILIRTTAAAMTLFQLYLAARPGTWQPMEQRVIHLGFVLLLMFLVYDFKGRLKTHLHITDLAFIGAGIAAMGYIYLHWEEAMWRATPTQYEFVLGIALIILVIEATRRAFGWAIPILTIVFLSYPFVGPYLPEPLTNRGFTLEQVIGVSYLYPEGIFGVPIAVMVTLAFMFIAFGVFAQKTGVTDLITAFALRLFGFQRGGPAKMSVVASCAFGTISGSGVANVLVDGVYTIPLMMRTGFRPHVAAAIEAVASTGGTFMPPVMAACGFIMAANLGIPYIKVCAAALIPALLYYLSTFIFVDMEAAKTGLRGASGEEIPSLKKAIKRWWPGVVGAIIMVILLVLRYAEAKAALYGLIVTVLGFTFSELVIYKQHSEVRKVFTLGALEECARGVIQISAACASIGLIIGVLNLTGLGGKMAGILVMLAGGSKVLLLLLAMIAAIILGMGVTPTAVYILLAGAIAPGIIMGGFNPIAAHFFILYYGCLGAITPPVALSCYAAAPIAKADPMRVGWAAWRIALPSFIIPFAFAFQPALVAQGPWWLTVSHAIPCAAGVFSVVAGVQGYLMGRVNIITRALLIMAGVGLISPDRLSTIAGAILLAVILGQRLVTTKLRKTESKSEPQF